MKKVALICLLLLGFLSIAIGLSTSTETQKVYPKVSTSKGLAPDLYLPDNPTPAIIKINEAKQAWFEERYAEACDLWREALNLKPNHPEGIWHDIGMCDMKIKNYNGAIQAYTNYINMISKEATSYWERGRAYLKSGDIVSAEKDFLEAISIDKYHTDSYFQMTLIEENRNDFEKALFYADKTIETEPSWSSGYENKAYLLHRLGKNQEAKDFLLQNRTVILGDSRNSSKDYFYNLLGDIYAALKDYPEAIENYQKALNINSNHPYAEVNICIALKEQGKGVEAVQHCLRGIDIFPHWNAFFNLCEAFAVAKQYDRGLNVCNFLINNEVFHYRTYKYCAMNKAGMGDIVGALGDVERSRIEVNKWEPEKVAVGEARTWLDNKEETLKSLDELEQDIKNGKYSNR